MKKLLLTLTLCCSALAAWAQPTVLGTQLANGTYTTYNLVDRGSFRQIQIASTSTGATGTRNWEFATGTAPGSVNYSTNWRPYTASQTLSAFNTIIDPATAGASARYNTGSGGQSGLLPAITTTRTYVVNVEENATANNFMNILECSFTPKTIASGAWQVGTGTGTYTAGNPTGITSCQSLAIRTTSSAALSTNEYVYLRYTTDNFATSTVVMMQGTATAITSRLPSFPAGTTVNYYMFSSNKALSALSSDIATFGVGRACDMNTINLDNNAGANYSYTVSGTACTTSKTENYCFTNTTGTYTAIATPAATLIGGLTDDTADNPANVGFDFWINGKRYTTFRATSNGFITFGATLPTSTYYTPISGTTGYDAAISGMGIDGQVSGGVLVQTSGTAPNRVCVVQYTGYNWYQDEITNPMNFQIRLYETTNVIEIIYGSGTPSTTARSMQVGLRGASNADFFNIRAVSGQANWNDAQRGSQNDIVASLNNTGSMFPSNGRIYRFTPSTTSSVCNAIAAPTGFTCGTATATTLPISWTDNSNTENGYVVYYSTVTNVPLDATNSTAVTLTANSTSYTATGLTSGTTYYFKVFALKEGLSSVLSGSCNTLTGQDVGVTALAAPTSSACQSSSTNVVATVRNFSATTLDFAVNPVTVTVAVSGVVTSSLTTTLTSGTLAGNTTMNVTVGQISTMTSGNYIFNSTATVGADINSANNANATTVSINYVAPTVSTSASPSTLCLSGSSTLTSTVTGSGSPFTYSWSAGTALTSASNPTGTISSTTAYTLTVTDVCGMTATSIVTVTVNNPSITASAGATLCGVGIANLSAIPSAGASITWYANATGGTALTTTNSYSPNVTATTVFYAEASSGGANGTVTLGTGTTAPGTTSYPNPLSAYYGGVKHQILFRASELSSYVVGSKITQLTFDLNAFAANACTNFTIRMGHTASTALSGFVTGTSTVYGPLTFTPSGTGLVTFTLASPFVWDGTSNIIVETVHNAGNGGNGSGTTANTTTTAFNSVYYGASDNVTGGISGFDALSSWTSSGTSTSRPNVRFITEPICASTRTAVTATVSTPPTFTVASGATVCNNELVAIPVTSNVADFTNYSWAPASSLYIDPSGTTAYTSQNVSVVYYKTTTAGVQIVTATANNTVTNCANVANVSMATLPASLNTATAASSALCLSGSTTVSVASIPTGALAQWQSSTDNVTFSDIVNATITSVSTGTITTTTYYRLQLLKSVGVSCTNSNVVTVTVSNPSITASTGATICGAGVVNLNATPSVSSSIAWYANSTGGAALTTTNSYSPNVTATTVFYAAAEVSGSSATLAIGAGGATSALAPVSPFNGGYGGQKSQYIFTQSQLLAAGLSAGRLSSLAFNVTSGAASYPAFSIQIGNTSLSQFATANIQGGLTTVRNPASYTTSVGLNTLSFNNGDFYWDGVSNIIVSINWSAANTSNTSATIQSDVVAGGVNVSQSYRKDSETAANLLAFTGATGAGTFIFDLSTSRPRITFGFIPVCSSNRTAVTATVNTAPAITVGAAPSTICNGSSTTLTVSSSNADYTYSWSNGLGAGASKTASPSANTTYTVTATDASGTGTFNGCVSTGSVAVSVNPSPTATTATTSAPTVCIGSTLNLSATTTPNDGFNVSVSEGFESGTTPTGWLVANSGSGNNWTVPATLNGAARTGARALEYNWNSSNAANTHFISPAVNLIAGVPCTVSSWYRGSGTTFPERFSVLVGTAQNAAAMVTVVNSTITVTNTTYAQQSAVFTPATSGAYYFSWNCTSVANMFYLDIDDISIVSTATYVPSYSWTSTPSGFTSAIQNPSGVAPTVTTTYRVVATNNFGCTATASVNVTVNPTPSLTVTTAPGCAQATGSVSGANTYTWSGGLGSTANVTATTSGNYFVTGTSSAGCTAVSSGNFDVRPLPPNPTVTLSSNTVCAGSNITVTGSGAFMYEFFQNNTTLGATTTNNTVTSTPINGDVWKARSYNGLSINGNFNDNEWGAPFATSTGGAAAAFGPDNRLDAFYFKSDPTNLNFGLAGNLDANNAILMFIDCKSGGFNSLSSWTNRSAATFGNNYYSLSNLNIGITFDAGFEADYCLAINGTAGTYYFDIYDMQANTNNYVGTTGNPGFSFQANTAEGDVTKGFEFFIPRSFLSNPTSLKTFTMLTNKPAVTDPTFLSNEFLTTANSGEGNYGNGAVNFASAAPNPINVSSAYVALSCFAESVPVTVTVNPNPTVTVSGTTPACVSTILTAAGATTYAWSTGSNVAAQNFTSSGTTNYTVTGTSSLGCTGTASGSAVVNAAPTVTATSDFSTINCTNPVAAVTLTGATSYAWSNGSNSGTGSPYNVTQTQGGTYTVTGTSTDGCTGTVSSTIAENFSAPSLSASPASTTITCASPLANITATGASSYAWSGGQSTAAATFNAAGTYDVVGTGANGCTASASAAVVADQAAPTVTLSGTNPACGTVTLTANGANSYAWSTGGNTATENFTTGGVNAFTVTGTGTNGCTGTASGSADVRNSGANVALTDAGDNANIMQQECEESGWTYYGDPDGAEAGKYYFAINWAPDGSLDAANAAAKSEAQVQILLNSGQYGITAGTGPTAQGTWVMPRSWNVGGVTTAITEPVQVRFFYDANEYNAVTTSAANFASANAGARLEPITWFKTVGIPYNPSDFSSTVTLNATAVYDNQSIPLPVSNVGTLNNVPFVEFANITSFSGGSLATGVGQGNPLPIKLEYFRGEKNGEQSDLTWRTQTEENNSHFIVERSLDGRDFRAIGQVQGAGNSASPINYAFTDENPVPGNNYYRLRQVDFNGASEFSNVVVLNFEKPFAVNAYPNPFNSTFTVDVYTTEESEGKLEVFDISGRLLDVSNLNLGVGMNRKEVDATLWTPGAYLIKVTAGSNVTQRTMVKTQF